MGIYGAKVIGLLALGLRQGITTITVVAATTVLTTITSILLTTYGILYYTAYCLLYYTAVCHLLLLGERRNEP